MSKLNVDTIEPEGASTTLTLGASGDTITIPSGATITNSGTASGFGLFTSYAIIADQKTQNTHGGTFTNGAWRERDLQTELADPDSIVSISANQFTLGAGSYYFRWRALTHGAGGHQSRLYNVTDAASVAISESGKDYGGYGGVSVGSARAVIAGTKAFSIEHQGINTVSTYGLGYAANITTEQYTTVEIYKEA
jgi:hypothetical protein